MDRQKAVMCPHRGKGPASGHPRAQKPPLGRSLSPPVWYDRLDAPGQWRGPLPSSVWTRHREVKQGKSGGSVGTTVQGKGKGSGERRIGQRGRGRTQGGGRPMGTTACGGKGQGKGKGSREGRIGQGGRGRTHDGERMMDTGYCGGDGHHHLWKEVVQGVGSKW